MRKFKVTTTMSNHTPAHRIRRPSKAIQVGDLIEFKFSTDTVKAVVKQWDAQTACAECVLFDKGNKLPRCVISKNSYGMNVLLCNSCKGSSFVFTSIDDLMEDL